MLMVTASPPVSPNVVARILMIQNPSVISGTLLCAASRIMALSRVHLTYLTRPPVVPRPMRTQRSPAREPQRYAPCPPPEPAVNTAAMTSSSSAGSQEYVGDPRNDNVLISINGELTPRP